MKDFAPDYIERALRGLVHPTSRPLIRQKLFWKFFWSAYGVSMKSIAEIFRKSSKAAQGGLDRARNRINDDHNRQVTG